MLLLVPKTRPRNAEVVLVFDPNVPPIIQADNWTCAACSLAHALRCIGVDVDEWEIVRLLGPNITQRWGLMKGNGADLESLLINHFGLNAKRDWLSFSEALDIAGSGPFVLGGDKWYHWCSVVGATDTELLIANPAPTWKDVGNRIDRIEWDRWGGWAGVWAEL